MLSSLNRAVRHFRVIDNVRSIAITASNCSTGSSSGNDDDKRNKARLKLDSLLQNIVTDETLAKDDPKPQMADPRPKLREKRAKQKKSSNLGEKIVDAARSVAKQMDSDSEETQAELLHKVISKDGKLQKSVFKAADQITLSRLLTELKVEQEKEKILGSSTLPSSKRETTLSRADMVSVRSTERSTKPEVQRVNVDIFGSKPFGIFSRTAKYESGPKLSTWEHCMGRELKITFTQPPRNIWEQMILWTDQGMLWQFPIDNEQGLVREQEVSFVDHVFLEVHLEDWCPKRGPIRHFMELVCVGLSRNHWLSADEKKAHIMWYKEYFLSKKQLIAEIGAGDFVEPVQTVQ